MNIRRTPWWCYILAILCGILAALLIMITDQPLVSTSVLGAPWIVLVILIILALLVIVLTWQVHRYVTTPPAKRRSILDPKKAVWSLMLAKTLGIAAAALLGWYGGQIVLSLIHIDIPFYAMMVVQCSFAVLVSFIDMVVGIIGEWLCQIPPHDDAQTVEKTHHVASQDMIHAAACDTP